MNDFKLQPADILVTVNRKKDLWSRIRRWAVGPYSHVYLFLGKVALLTDWRQGRLIRAPLIFESNGRGCCLRLLSERYGETVVVMRLKSYEDRKRIPAILTEAIKLASDESARYDYWCITRFIIPRIICEKLRLPLPLSWHRNPKQVCSEAVFEVFYRGGLEGILPTGVVPLPWDFVDSPLLGEVWQGQLMLDAQPK